MDEINTDYPDKAVFDYVIEYSIKLIKVVGIALAFIILADVFGDNINMKWRSPVVFESRELVEQNIRVLEPVNVEKTPENESEGVNSEGFDPIDYQSWEGSASWYGASPSECVGCNPNFIMANGQKLDDTKKTLAFNKLPLGTWVVITNMDNGKSEEVEITDTGGFESLGRIADMSKALKEALGCGDLCNVEVKTY